MISKIDPAGLDIGQIGGRRNLIINGAMQVWQRGTSQSVSGGYGADRFWMANAASASRSTDVPTGFTYSTKLTYSASNMAMGQPIELVATGSSSPMVAGESVTLSFYAKVDSGTEAFDVLLKFRDSKFLSNNESVFTPVGGSEITATTTWQRFTKTFIVPTVNATNVLAGLEFHNIGKDFYITGVQLEVGTVATPFEHRSYGEELALCQRYYYLPDAGQTGVIPYNTVYATVTYPLPVTMRAAPTASGTNATMTYTLPFLAAGATGQFNSAEGVGKSCFTVNYSELSRTDSYGNPIVVNTSDVQFDAEL